MNTYTHILSNFKVFNQVSLLFNLNRNAMKPMLFIKYSFIGITCLLLIIVGCSKNSVDSVTPSDVRDKFVGKWDRSYSSKCKSSTVLHNGTLTITKSTSKSNVVILDYRIDGINKPEAIINNNAISFSGLSTTFSEQSGSGQISTDGKSINITGVSDEGSYVGVCTTQEIWTKK